MFSVFSHFRDVIYTFFLIFGSVEKFTQEFAVWRSEKMGQLCDLQKSFEGKCKEWGSKDFRSDYLEIIEAGWTKHPRFPMDR